MTLFDIKEIDLAFDQIKLAHKVDPEKWRQQIIEQLTVVDGIDELRDLAKIKAIIMNFVEKHDISCEEVVYQTDRVIVNAYEFIHDLVEIVGYKKYDDDE